MEEPAVVIIPLRTVTVPVGTQDPTARMKVYCTPTRSWLVVNWTLSLCTFSDLLPKLSKWRNMSCCLFLCLLCVSQWVHRSLLPEQRYVCMNCCVCPSEHWSPTYGFQLPVDIRLYFISTWLPCHDPLPLVPSLQSLLTAVQTGSAGMVAHALTESASVLKEPPETTARSLVSL